MPRSGWREPEPGVPARQTGVDERGGNNFDALRLVLACSVMLSHSFYFTVTALPEPLLFITRGELSAGELAVDGFFLLSGYLITASWFRSHGVLDYAKKRALRIYPGFLACYGLSLLVVAPIGQPNVGRFYRSIDWARLPFSLLTFDVLRLPDEFVTLLGYPLRNVNGSLWTIRLEVECYVLLALLGLLKVLERPLAVLAVFVVAYVAYVLALPPLTPGREPAGESGSPPATTRRAAALRCVLPLRRHGAQVHRARLVHDVRLLLAAAALFVLGMATHTTRIAAPFALGYALFYLGYHPSIPLHDVARKRDLSYGIYLYAWPVQYLLMLMLGRGLNPYVFCALCLPPTAVAAAVSWKVIERPALRSKARSATTAVAT